MIPPRATIVHDTHYRRLRRRIAQGAHRMDDSIVSTFRVRPRVLFEAASPMSFAIFQSVYRRLRVDPRLEFWFTAPGRAWRPEAIFSAVGVTERVIGATEATWRKWDLCINTDFWEMTSLRRRTRRVHLFHGVAGKYELDAPVDLAPEVASFACLMFPNHDRLQRYIEAALVPATSFPSALVGYPKADALVDGSLNRDATCAALQLDACRPIVTYAPTWSPYSSLNESGVGIIDGLAKAGYQVVVKLHDRSYDPRPRASGGVDWAQRLARYEGHPKVRVARGADASSVLFVSDALVTDHSSIGFEFMLLDRPLVVIDCPELVERAAVSADKVQRLRAAADVVRSASDVPDAVAGGLAHPLKHSSRRRATAEALFWRAGTATSRAVGLIYELLGLPAPLLQESRPDSVVVSAA
jgi:CDP-Glycerol:Poly(glycerophosphate) glycerophosphotransferase